MTLVNLDSTAFVAIAEDPDPVVTAVQVNTIPTRPGGGGVWLSILLGWALPGTDPISMTLGMCPARVKFIEDLLVKMQIVDLMDIFW